MDFGSFGRPERQNSREGYSEAWNVPVTAHTVGASKARRNSVRDQLARGVARRAHPAACPTLLKAGTNGRVERERAPLRHRDDNEQQCIVTRQAGCRVPKRATAHVGKSDQVETNARRASMMLRAAASAPPCPAPDAENKINKPVAPTLAWHAKTGADVGVSSTQYAEKQQKDLARTTEALKADIRAVTAELAEWNDQHQPSCSSAPTDAGGVRDLEAELARIVAGLGIDETAAECNVSRCAMTTASAEDNELEMLEALLAKALRCLFFTAGGHTDNEVLPHASLQRGASATPACASVSTPTGATAAMAAAAAAASASASTNVSAPNVNAVCSSSFVLRHRNGCCSPHVRACVATAAWGRRLVTAMSAERNSLQARLSAQTTELELFRDTLNARNVARRRQKPLSLSGEHVSAADENNSDDDLVNESQQEPVDAAREMKLKLANAQLQLSSSRRKREALEKRCSLAHQKLDCALHAAENAREAATRAEMARRVSEHALAQAQRPLSTACAEVRPQMAPEYSSKLHCPCDHTVGPQSHQANNSTHCSSTDVQSKLEQELNDITQAAESIRKERNDAVLSLAREEARVKTMRAELCQQRLDHAVQHKVLTQQARLRLCYSRAAEQTCATATERRLNSMLTALRKDFDEKLRAKTDELLAHLEHSPKIVATRSASLTARVAACAATTAATVALEAVSTAQSRVIHDMDKAARSSHLKLKQASQAVRDAVKSRQALIIRAKEAEVASDQAASECSALRVRFDDLAKKNQELCDDMKAKDSKISEKQAHVSELTLKIESLETELQTSRTELSSVRQRAMAVDASAAQTLAATAKIKGLEMELQRVQTDLVNARQQERCTSARVAEQMAESKTKFEEEVQRMRIAATEAAKEATEKFLALQGDVARANDRSERLEAQLAQAKLDADAAAQNSADKALVDAQRKHEEFVEEQTRAANAMELELSRARSEVIDATKLRVAAEQIAAVRETKLQSVEQDSAVLHAKLQSERAKARKAEAAAAAAEKHAQNATAEVEKLGVERAALLEAKAAADAAQLGAEAETQAATAAQQKLRVRVMELERKLTATEAQVTIAKQESTDIASRASETGPLKQQVEELKNQLKLMSIEVAKGELALQAAQKNTLSIGSTSPDKLQEMHTTIQRLQEDKDWLSDELRRIGDRERAKRDAQRAEAEAQVAAVREDLEKSQLLQQRQQAKLADLVDAGVVDEGWLDVRAHIDAPVESVSVRDQAHATVTQSDDVIQPADTDEGAKNGKRYYQLMHQKVKDLQAKLASQSDTEKITTLEQDLLEARQRQAQWEEALATEQNYRKSQQRKMSEQLTQLKSQCSEMQKDVAAKERELGEARTQLRKRVDFLTSKNYVLEKDKCSLQNAAEQARVLATEQETKVRKLESKLQEMRTAMSHEKQRADSLSRELRKMERQILAAAADKEAEVKKLRLEMQEMEVEVSKLKRSAQAKAKANEGRGWTAGQKLVDKLPDEVRMVWDQLQADRDRLEEDQKLLSQISNAMNARLSLQLDLIASTENGLDEPHNTGCKDSAQLHQLQRQLQGLCQRSSAETDAGAPGELHEALRIAEKARKECADSKHQLAAERMRFDQYKEQALARIAKLERENVRISRGGGAMSTR